MKRSTFVFKSLVFYKFRHLFTILGIAISSAIIIGALAVGFSVKKSLYLMLDNRLGKVQVVIESRNFLFNNDLTKTIEKTSNSFTSSVLIINAVGFMPNSENESSNLQLIGIEPEFYSFTSRPPRFKLPSEQEVIINENFANEINCKIGDEIIIQIENPQHLASEIPYNQEYKNILSIRVKVKDIALNTELGNFSLKSNQISPNNVFISFTELNKVLKLNNKANLILCGSEDQIENTDVLEDALKKNITIDNYGLKIRSLKKISQLELYSSSAFLQDFLVDSICKYIPGVNKTLSYFVNSIETKNKLIPYSFVSAPGNDITEKLKIDEIIINQWAASDLGLNAGDSVLLKYYIYNRLRVSEEKSKYFKIKSVIPISSWADDPFLMPNMDGFNTSESCKNWETGIEINFTRIRPKDELYWNRHKGTPKAFISYKAASELWKNQYGSTTSLRFSGKTNIQTISSVITEKINPTQMSYNVIKIRDKGVWSVNNAVDFSGLFIGLSFILFITSLILNSILISLYFEKRLSENTILISLGFTLKRAFLFLFYEVFWIILSGILVGNVLGMLFGKIIIKLINSVWIDLVQVPTFVFHSDIIVFISGSIISFISLYILILFTGNIKYRKFLSKSINYKFREDYRTNGKTIKYNILNKLLYNKLIWFTVVLCIFIFLILYIFTNSNFQSTGLFMLLGLSLLILLLLSFKSVIYKYLSLLPGFNINKLLIANFEYNKIRYNSILILVALSVFLVFSTGLNRIPEKKDWDNKKSGTGGYAFYAESAISINEDLNKVEIREKFNLQGLNSEVYIIQARVFDGEDASCLNLNRAKQPRIIGLNTSYFASDENFTFTNTLKQLKNKNIWKEMVSTSFPNIIPGIADQTVITWGLGKKVGDTITYLSENGQQLKIVLIAGLENSIFQGNIIVDEKYFEKYYPNTIGTKVFLVSTPAEKKAIIRTSLQKGLKKYGIKIQSSNERLSSFNQVTNTYLQIFMVLGILSLILGIFGITLVVLRTLQERKEEMALMLAVGIRKSKLIAIVIKENLLIIGYSYFVGFFCALISNANSIFNSSYPFPWFLILIFTIIYFLFLIFGIIFCIKIQFKNELTNVLRNE